MGARVDRRASIIRGFEFSKIRKTVGRKKKNTIGRKNDYAFHLSILNLIHSLIIRIFGKIYIFI